MIKKKNFSQLNDKRFYFPNGIISLPFGHLHLKEIDEYKNEKGQRIEKYFWDEKENFLKLEKSSEKIRFFKYNFNASTKNCKS